MTEPVLLVLFALFTLWWGAASVLALKLRPKSGPGFVRHQKDLRRVMRSPQHGMPLMRSSLPGSSPCYWTSRLRARWTGRFR